MSYEEDIGGFDSDFDKKFDDDFRELFGRQLIENRDFGCELWSAMANISWYHNDDPDSNICRRSYRGAGCLIADMLGTGKYTDWYCSGPYETVSEYIAGKMASKGWRYVPDSENDNVPSSLPARMDSQAMSIVSNIDPETEKYFAELNKKIKREIEERKEQSDGQKTPINEDDSSSGNDALANISILTAAIAHDPGRDKSYYHRGLFYADLKQWSEAEADFAKAFSLWTDPEYLTQWRNAARELQILQGIDKRIAPYAAMIEKLKSQPLADTTGTGEMLGLESAAEYTELIAVMALLEEYELLEFFFTQQKFRGKEFSAHDLLNGRVRLQFAYWEPTPLYFITAKKALERMKDPVKMINLLGEYGADPNIPAGDGSTPLWNQCNTETPAAILEALLKIGANPNQTSRDAEYDWVPLAYCILPIPAVDSNGEPIENKVEFCDVTSIAKALILLNYHADPNLANPYITDLPPLMLAIRYGVRVEGNTVEVGPHIAELIDALLAKGADFRFTDSEGNTPLSLAGEFGLLRIGLGKRMSALGLYTEISAKVKEMEGSVVLPPAGDEQIARCCSELEKNGFSALPCCYIDFLKICNGYSFDGIELYGTDTVTNDEQVFKLNDAAGMTKYLQELNGEHVSAPYLWLGRKHGDYITYDCNTGFYQLRSHESPGQVCSEYDTFEELFYEEVDTFSYRPPTKEDICP